MAQLLVFYSIYYQFIQNIDCQISKGLYLFQIYFIIFKTAPNSFLSGTGKNLPDKIIQSLSNFKNQSDFAFLPSAKSTSKNLLVDSTFFLTLYKSMTFQLACQSTQSIDCLVITFSNISNSFARNKYKVYLHSYPKYHDATIISHIQLIFSSQVQILRCPVESPRLIIAVMSQQTFSISVNSRQFIIMHTGIHNSQSLSHNTDPSMDYEQESNAQESVLSSYSYDHNTRHYSYAPLILEQKYREIIVQHNRHAQKATIPELYFLLKWDLTEAQLILAIIDLRNYIWDIIGNNQLQQELIDNVDIIELIEEGVQQMRGQVMWEVLKLVDVLAREVKEEQPLYQLLCVENVGLLKRALYSTLQFSHRNFNKIGIMWLDLFLGRQNPQIISLAQQRNLVPLALKRLIDEELPQTAPIVARILCKMLLDHEIMKFRVHECEVLAAIDFVISQGTRKKKSFVHVRKVLQALVTYLLKQKTQLHRSEYDKIRQLLKVSKDYSTPFMGVFSWLIQTCDIHSFQIDTYLKRLAEQFDNQESERHYLLLKIAYRLLKRENDLTGQIIQTMNVIIGKAIEKEVLPQHKYREWLVALYTVVLRKRNGCLDERQIRRMVSNCVKIAQVQEQKLSKKANKFIVQHLGKAVVAFYEKQNEQALDLFEKHRIVECLFGELQNAKILGLLRRCC